MQITNPDDLTLFNCGMDQGSCIPYSGTGAEICVLACGSVAPIAADLCCGSVQVRGVTVSSKQSVFRFLLVFTGVYRDLLRLHSTIQGQCGDIVILHIDVHTQSPIA